MDWWYDCQLIEFRLRLRSSPHFSIRFYFQSVPGVGGDKKEDEGLTREELQEQERLR